MKSVKGCGSMFLNNQKGMALFSVLMIMTVTTLLGTAVWFASSQEILATERVENQNKAYHFAQSGVEKAISIIKSGDCNDWEDGREKEYYGEFYTQSSDESSGGTFFFKEDTIEDYNIRFRIKKIVEEDEEDNDMDGESYFIIKSVGIARTGIDGSAEAQSEGLQFKIAREAIADVDNGIGVGESEEIPWALFSMEDITLDNAVIRGNVGTNSTDSGSVSFSWGAYIYDGSLYLGPNVNWQQDDVVNFTGWQRGPDTNIPDGSIKNLPTLQEYNFPNYEYPDFPDFQFPSYQNPITVNSGESISNNGWYKIKVKNGDLIINTGNQGNILKVCVTDLDLKQAHIKLTGSGQLHLYVRDSFSMKNSTINNEGNSDSVIISLENNIKEVTLQGNSDKIFGNIYAEEADFLLKSDSVIRGNIFTEGSSIELDGSSREAVIGSILAKNANVLVKGDAVVKGNIFVGGESVEIKGSPREAVIGSILAENASILVKGSARVKGDIIAGGENVEVKGGNRNAIKGILYAPKSNIDVLSSAKVFGTVIAKICTVTGEIAADKNLDTDFFNSLDWGSVGPPSLFIDGREPTPPNSTWRDRGTWSTTNI